MNKSRLYHGMWGISGNSRPVVITLLFSVYIADCANIAATIGAEVILPCNCSKSSSLLSWQRGETIVYTGDSNLTAPQYRYRTGIQQNSCFLILSQVDASDEGDFICYYEDPSFSFEQVSLQVTGAAQSLSVSETAGVWKVSVVSVVCGLLMVLLIILSAWITKMLSRTQVTRGNQPKQAQPEQEDIPDEHDRCI